MASKPTGRPPGRPRKAAKNPDAERPASAGGPDYQGIPLRFWEGEDPTQTRVRMSREAPNKKWEFHGYLSTDEASPERISEMFGGGRYMVQLVTATAEGPSTIKETKLVVIPGGYRPPVGPLPGMQAATYPAAEPLRPVAREPGPGVAEIDAWTVATRRMQAGTLSPREALDQAVVSQLLELSKTARSGSVDWGAILAQTLPLVVDRLMSPRREESEIGAKLDRLAALLESGRAAGPVTSSIADLTQAMEQVMDIRERLGGGGKSEEEGGGLMKVGLELIRTLADAAKVQGAASPAGSRIPGKTEVPMPAHPVPAPGNPSAPLWQQLLAHYRGQLVDAARRGLAPGFIADVVLNYLPADYVGVLTEFLARPDAEQVVIQEIPELAEFQGWNAKLWQEIRSAMQDDGEESGDPE